MSFISRVNMKKILIFFVAILFLSSCINQKTRLATQGIIGEVRWVEGNLMPNIGDTTYVARAKGFPIEREVFIYLATKPDETARSDEIFYTSINTRLVKKIMTEKDGSFKVNVPTGKYSVFVMEKDGLFANKFDGDNYINPVTVQANNFTEIQILVNYKAYY